MTDATSHEDHLAFERQLGSALRRLRDRLGELESERDAASARADRAEQKLEEVYASETWRVGDLVLRVPKRVRDALGR